MGIFSFLSLGLDTSTLIIVLIAWLFALLIGFTLHEFSHALIAYKMGDDTARLLGRMSLNPFAHFDVAGGLCLLLFGFGWAKPVPINTLRFKNKRAGEICVSIAGVVANFILAIIFIFLNVVIMLFLDVEANNFYLLLYYLTYFGSTINLMLALFNILPIYPLDGYNLLTSVFKIPYMCKFDRFMRQYGSILLMCIIIIPALINYSFLSDAIYWVYNNIALLFFKMFI